ncbi:MAG: NCS1 family nucleobase:cation symporter-1 [Desulfobacterales bacterium]
MGIVREVNGMFELTEELPRSQFYNRDLAPVKLSKRTWGYYEYFSMWVGMSVCVPTWMLGASMIAAGFDWLTTVFTIFLGNLIVLLPMILDSFAGTKYGIPFPVFLRSSFGLFGANIPALLRGIIACGWFGIQTMIMAFAIDGILSALSPGWGEMKGLVPFFQLPAHTVWAFSISWIITVAICYVSPPWKASPGIRWLNNLSSPILILIGVGLLFWAVSKAGGMGPILDQPRTAPWSKWPAFLTAMVAYWSTLALNIPDLTRFARSQKVQYLGQSLGLPPTMTAYSFFGVAVTSATVIIFGEAIWDPVKLMIKTEIPFFIFVGLIFVILATLTTNITANMVAPVNDFMNVAPKFLNWERTTILIGLIGILMQPWRFLADPKAYIWTWLLGYGAFTGGIAGVIICDYWIIRKQKLKLHAIYVKEGYYNFATDKVNWIAVVYGLFLVAVMIFLWSQKAILGEGWPSTLTALVLVLGLLAGIYFYVSKIKGVNFAGVLALFTGIAGSLVLSMASAALAQWTWFTGAFIGYAAYYVLYKVWYGAHHQEVPV